MPPMPTAIERAMAIRAQQQENARRPPPTAAQLQTSAIYRQRDRGMDTAYPIDSYMGGGAVPQQATLKDIQDLMQKRRYGGYVPNPGG